MFNYLLSYYQDRAYHKVFVRATCRDEVMAKIQMILPQAYGFRIEGFKKA